MSKKMEILNNDAVIEHLFKGNETKKKFLVECGRCAFLWWSCLICLKRVITPKMKHYAHDFVLKNCSLIGFALILGTSIRIE